MASPDEKPALQEERQERQEKKRGKRAQANSMQTTSKAPAESREAPISPNPAPLANVVDSQADISTLRPTVELTAADFPKCRSCKKPGVPLCPEFYFFHSLVPDVNKLTPARRRQFKEKVLFSLNNLLQEQEYEREFRMPHTRTPRAYANQAVLQPPYSQQMNFSFPAFVQFPRPSRAHVVEQPTVPPSPRDDEQHF